MPAYSTDALNAAWQKILADAERGFSVAWGQDMARHWRAARQQPAFSIEFSAMAAETDGPVPLPTQAQPRTRHGLDMYVVAQDGALTVCFDARQRTSAIAMVRHKIALLVSADQRLLARFDFDHYGYGQVEELPDTRRMRAALNGCSLNFGAEDIGFDALTPET